MLVIGRKTNEGVYIGRDIRVTVTEVMAGRTVALLVETAMRDAVSLDDDGLRQHLKLQRRREQKPWTTRWQLTFMVSVGRGLYIGRDVHVRVLDAQGDGMSRLGIDAPRHIAVSRTDFSLEQYLRWQEQRDAVEPLPEKGGTTHA